MLKIYNTLTKQKEIFKPITPGKIKLYVCGITVYDYCHIGHGRSMVVFDMITRYLRYRNFEVNFVRNITDIDDKIIVRAYQNNETVDNLTARFITAMHDDERALNILPPNHEPRATHTISEMLAMIQKLLDKGYAYVGENGDIYYEVTKFKNYGKLSHQNIEQLRAGERTITGNAKNDSLDFVLWKIAKAGEPKWQSPWGAGRPGWHIECSAMSTTLLGNNFDIHGGGLDLQFPHHENEIAQSEAATDCHFANYWMHAGLVQVNNEKMSKSLNNFFTIRDVLAKHHREIVRYFMLASHYRSPVNYSEDNLANAQVSLDRFYAALRDLPDAAPIKNSDYEQRFIEAMDDDFNTPIALAVLFDIVRDINKTRETDINKAAELAATLKKLANIFGILQCNPEEFLKSGFNAAEVENLIAKRKQARAEKNWVESDRIRDQLHALGIAIEDSSQDTTWRRI